MLTLNTSALQMQMDRYKVGGREVLPSPTCREGHKIFAKILAAMTCVECGIKMNEVDVKSIEEGWRLASPKSKD